MKARRRLTQHPVLDDDDPLSGMVNLFDLAIVFAVGLIAALALALRDGRLAPHPGSASPPTIDVKDGSKLDRYRPTSERAAGPGRLIGTAYRLPNGEVVYVPDESAPASSR